MSILTQDYLYKGFTFSTDKNKIPVLAVHEFLSKESYWARNIPLETVSKSVDHSTCIVVLKDTTLAGFGRIITDRATFAYIADIFILSAFRGLGLSKSLMRHFISLVDEWGLRRTILTTQDAHSLYAQFDFIPFPWPERLMMYQNSRQYTGDSHLTEE